MKKSFLAFMTILFLSDASYGVETSVVGFPEDAFASGGVAFCKSQPVGFFGFKKEAKGLSLVPVTFETKNSTEEMSAVDMAAIDPKPKTCWVLITAVDFPILVKGLKLEGTPRVITEFLGTKIPGENGSFIVETKKYSLKFPTISSADYQCQLGEEIVDLDGGGFEIILASDLNKDGFPDFIVQNAPKYTFKKYEILMSDKASKKCKVLASREVYSC